MIESFQYKIWIKITFYWSFQIGHIAVQKLDKDLNMFIFQCYYTDTKISYQFNAWFIGTERGLNLKLFPRTC